MDETTHSIIDRIPPELWREVFDHIDPVQSPIAYVNLAQTCRMFQQLSEPILYSSIGIQIRCQPSKQVRHTIFPILDLPLGYDNISSSNRPENAATLRRLFGKHADGPLARHVRHLTVRGVCDFYCFSNNIELSGCAMHLAAMEYKLSLMTNLTGLRWCSVYDQLNNRGPEVHYMMPPRFGYIPVEVFRELANPKRPSLRTLSLENVGGFVRSSPLHVNTPVEFWEVFSSSFMLPAMFSQLEVYQVRSQLGPANVTSEAMVFTCRKTLRELVMSNIADHVLLENGAPLGAKLETLHWWMRHVGDKLQLRYLDTLDTYDDNTFGFQGAKERADALAEIIELGKLKTLKFSGSRLVTACLLAHHTGKFTSLESLQADLTSFTTTYVNAHDEDGEVAYAALLALPRLKILDITLTYTAIELEFLSTATRKISRRLWKPRVADGRKPPRLILTFVSRFFRFEGGKTAMRTYLRNIYTQRRYAWELIELGVEEVGLHELMAVDLRTEGLVSADELWTEFGGDVSLRDAGQEIEILSDKWADTSVGETMARVLVKSTSDQWA